MSQLTRPEATIAGPGSAKTVDELLAQARGMLPHRPSPDEALRAQASGALLVDIRGDDQRRDGLIPGALVIPRNCLEWRCDPTSQWRHPVITRRDLRIILVCHEGYQSSLAAATLQQLGLIHATDLDGGFTAWAAAGLPVIAPSATGQEQLAGGGAQRGFGASDDLVVRRSSRCGGNDRYPDSADRRGAARRPPGHSVWTFIARWF